MTEHRQRWQAKHNDKAGRGSNGVLVCVCVWLQNCLIRWEGSMCSAIVGDFGLAEKIPNCR